MIQSRRTSKKPLSPEKALVRLEELCARAEHCTYELAQKLKLWGVAGDDAEAIIYSLRRRRFVDDGRFAVSFVRDRYRYSKWGRIKIRQHLQAKRVAPDLIEDAFEEIDEEEYMAILQGIVKAKACSMPEVSSYEARTKIYRFAFARGFEPALISRCMKDMKDEL